MKVKKKFAALLLSVLMVLTLLPAGALADTTVGTITIKDSTDTSAQTTSTFNAYEVASFKASLDATSKTVYTDAQILPAYKNTILTALTNAGLPTTGTDDVLLNELNDSKMSADALLALASNLKKVVTGTPIVSNGGKINVSQFGYYLIIETAKSSTDTTLYTDPILVGVPLQGASAITKDFDVKVKTSNAGVVKKIVLPDPSDNTKNILVDSNTVIDKVGTPVNYQSVSDIPFYSSLYTTPTYYLTDTFSAGLKFSGTVNASIVDKSGNPMASLTKDTDYTFSSDDHSFKLTLKPGIVKTYGAQGGKLKVTYSATITDQAVVGSTGNPNTITLTYSNNPSDGTYTTPPDSVITYINLFTLNKFDNGSTPAPVNGAGFTLYHKTGVDASNQPIWSADNDPTNETVSTANGIAQFKTLLPGNTYKLVETTVPGGLSKAADVIFTVKATNTNAGTAYDIPNQSIIVPTEGTDGASANTAIANDFKASWTVPDNGNIKVASDGTLSTTITDNRGFILPGTGGIGTTIFFVSGIAILLLGGFMALVYTKKRKKTGSHFQH